MFGSGQIAGQRPRPKSLPRYISWYINGYGRPRTSLDLISKMRPGHGQIAGAGGGLLATTEQMATRHVPRGPISIHALCRLRPPRVRETVVVNTVSHQVLRSP
jgi:hypothetical protein